MRNTLKRRYFLAVDELSVFSWLHCLRGDLQYLRRDLFKGSAKLDAKAWYEFQVNFCERIPMNPVQLQFLQLKKDLAEAMIAYTATPEGDPAKGYLYNDVESLQDEMDFLLKSLPDQMDPNEIDKKIVEMSNRFKRSIRTKEISVLEYFLIREEYNQTPPER